MSSSRSRWPCPSFSTTPHEDRRRPGPGSEMKYTAKFRTTPPPQPVLFSLYDEEPGGRRPTGLVRAASGRRSGFQRHTVEQMADVAPMVQILDAPVPQNGGARCMDVLKTFDRGLVRARAGYRSAQGYSSGRGSVCVQCSVLPQLAEQLVDMPVPESVILAHGRCDLGVKWCQIATQGGRCYWWMAGTRHVQWRRPEGFTASPGRYINTGQG